MFLRGVSDRSHSIQSNRVVSNLPVPPFTFQPRTSQQNPEVLSHITHPVPKYQRALHTTSVQNHSFFPPSTQLTNRPPIASSTQRKADPTRMQTSDAVRRKAVMVSNDGMNSKRCPRFPHAKAPNAPKVYVHIKRVFHPPEVTVPMQESYGRPREEMLHNLKRRLKRGENEKSKLKRRDRRRTPKDSFARDLPLLAKLVSKEDERIGRVITS
jgi:hypothetical protein